MVSVEGFKLVFWIINNKIRFINHLTLDEVVLLENLSLSGSSQIGNSYVLSIFTLIC